MTLSPTDEVEKVLKFIGENFNDSVLTGDTPFMIEGKFPYQSNVPVPNSNNWGGLVIPNEVEEIQRICFPVMQKYQYENY